MFKVTVNRRGRLRYQIHKRFEAGMVLQGSEIKLLRQHCVSIDQAYALFNHTKELYLKNIIWGKKTFINTYSQPRDHCKLLLHKKQLQQIYHQTHHHHLLMIPLMIYIKHNYAKVTLGLGRALKKHDRRLILKTQEHNRRIHQYEKKKNY